MPLAQYFWYGGASQYAQFHGWRRILSEGVSAGQGWIVFLVVGVLTGDVSGDWIGQGSVLTGVVSD